MIIFHALAPCGCDSSAKLPYFCLHVQAKHDISLHHCLGNIQTLLVHEPDSFLVPYLGGLIPVMILYKTIPQVGR